MPQIYDNVESPLVDGLRRILPEAVACSFCVGYLSLRGWDQLADLVEHLSGSDEDHACRILVGMHRPPDEEMRLLQGIHRQTGATGQPSLFIDGPTAARLRRRITELQRTA
jgi:hypothetical protein